MLSVGCYTLSTTQRYREKKKCEKQVYSRHTTVPFACWLHTVYRACIQVARLYSVWAIPVSAFRWCANSYHTKSNTNSKTNSNTNSMAIRIKLKSFSVNGLRWEVLTSTLNS